MGERPPAALHPLVAGFTDAAVYDRGRARYPEQVVRTLMDDLALTAGDPVLELGPGTGQLSRPLLAAGLELTAIEPLAAMRELLAEAIGAGRILDGVAEDIPVRAASVGAVFAADSFHWFDEARAMAEIKRVLRPGGGLAILRTLPDLTAREEPWTGELAGLLTDARPEHPAFSDRAAAAALEEDDAFGEVVERTLSSERVMDVGTLLDALASFSWIGIMPAPRREQLLADARALLTDAGVSEARVRILHMLWSARLHARAA